MTILLDLSICKDCIWKQSCMSFKKVNEMADKRENVQRGIFEVVVQRCSNYNMDRSYRK